MNPRLLVVAAFPLLASVPVQAQRTRVNVSDGDVARRALTARRPARGDPGRLAPVIPGVPSAAALRVRVAGDSAQRIALDDFDWRGRVSSVEIDEQDSRLFWDVKIVPDSTRDTIVRYRVDAVSGGIIEIKEFTGIRGLARNRPRS